MMSIIVLGIVIYILYRIVKRQDKKDTIATSVHNVAQKTVDLNKKSNLSDNAKLVISVIIVAIFVTVIFINNLTAIGINFFLFFDKLFNIAPLNNLPVSAWIVLGSLIGLLVGALVAWKKYKLGLKFIFLPITFFVLIASLFFIVNKPLNIETLAFFNNNLEKTTTEAYQFVNVQSTNSLPEYRNINYGIANVIDKDDNTAWVEYANNSGIENDITFTFNKSSIEQYKYFKCTGFKIKNGYAKTGKLWNDYNRIKECILSINGSFCGNVAFANNTYNQWEEVSIKSVNIKYGDKLALKINGVYYGYKKDKNAITELIPIVEYSK